MGCIRVMGRIRVMGCIRVMGSIPSQCSSSRPSCGSDQAGPVSAHSREGARGEAAAWGGGLDLRVSLSLSLPERERERVSA